VGCSPKKWRCDWVFRLGAVTSSQSSPPEKQGTGAGDPRLDGGAGAPSIYYFFYIPHEENVMTIMTNRNPLPHKPSGVIVTLMTSR